MSINKVYAECWRNNGKSWIICNKNLQNVPKRLKINECFFIQTILLRRFPKSMNATRTEIIYDFASIIWQYIGKYVAKCCKFVRKWNIFIFLKEISQCEKCCENLWMFIQIVLLRQHSKSNSSKVLKYVTITCL
jgi:hypothetical protein